MKIWFDLMSLKHLGAVPSLGHWGEMYSRRRLVLSLLMGNTSFCAQTRPRDKVGIDNFRVDFSDARSVTQTARAAVCISYSFTNYSTKGGCFLPLCVCLLARWYKTLLTDSDETVWRSRKSQLIRFRLWPGLRCRYRTFLKDFVLLRDREILRIAVGDNSRSCRWSFINFLSGWLSY